MNKVTIILSILILAFGMNACKKSTAKGNYPYNVRMTDAPGPYSAVYVDIKDVEITGDNGKAVLLNVHAGIYNLINFSNGIDTLIASGSLETSNVQQIRLILGSRNSVVDGGITYPLSTPSADQSGLKLQVNQTLQAGVLYSVLLDFDVNKSIVKEGNGSYKLKPVIRTVEAALSGSIKGKISIAGALAVVTATSSSNETYSSNVIATGDFLLMGIPAGIYTVTITPAIPLNPVIKTNVTVTTGVTTNIGTVIL